MQSSRLSCQGDEGITERNAGCRTHTQHRVDCSWLQHGRESQTILLARFASRRASCLITETQGLRAMQRAVAGALCAALRGQGGALHHRRPRRASFCWTSGMVPVTRTCP